MASISGIMTVDNVRLGARVPGYDNTNRWLLLYQPAILQVSKTGGSSDSATLYIYPKNTSPASSVVQVSFLFGATNIHLLDVTGILRNYYDTATGSTIGYAYTGVDMTFELDVDTGGVVTSSTQDIKLLRRNHIEQRPAVLLPKKLRLPPISLNQQVMVNFCNHTTATIAFSGYNSGVSNTFTISRNSASDNLLAASTYLIKCGSDKFVTIERAECAYLRLSWRAVMDGGWKEWTFDVVGESIDAAEATTYRRGIEVLNRCTKSRRVLQLVSRNMAWEDWWYIRDIGISPNVRAYDESFGFQNCVLMDSLPGVTAGKVEDITFRVIIEEDGVWM